MKAKKAAAPKPSTFADIQLDAILDAIVQTGSKMGAADRLGISRVTVMRYIERGYSDRRKFKIVSTGYRRYTVEWPNGRR